jgi:hypothetical protein
MAALATSKQPIDDAVLSAQIQPFLDEWYYRILHSPVGKQWNRNRALTLLMDVFGMIGINIPTDKREELVVSDDDATLVEAIILALPGELRESFEATALQIQTVLHEATRILCCAEEEGDEPVATLFEEAGSERGGLTQQVLKSSVVHAAKEVSRLRRLHTSWRKNTDGRIDRLLMAAEEAEHCQQQLMAAEAQLAEYTGNQKSKNKGLLMNMAEGKDKTLLHSCFSSWLGFVAKCRSEKEIRDRFQAQIDGATDKLLKYKEAQIANIRGVLMRGAMEDQDVLMHMVWKFWMDEVNERKADGDTAEALKAVQDRLNSFEASQRENAGKFMTRMAAGNDESLKNLCLEAWIKFHQDYAKDREMEEKVKAAEAAFKAHMDAKKDEAKTVMDRMLAGTDNGLLAMIIQNWTQWIKDEKKQKELEFALNEASDKFKTLNGRQKAGAHGAQTRVNDQMNANIMQRIFNNWIVETKANRVECHYNTKYESKRRQLQGVQNLFKSFAMQLEQNLGGDDDSSSRTTRRTTGRSRHGKGMNKGEGSVSLPDIHQKPAPVAS